MDVWAEIGEKFIRQAAVLVMFSAGVMLFLGFVIRKRRSEKRFSPLTEDMLRFPGEHLEKKLSDLLGKLMLGIFWMLLPATFLLTREVGVFGWAIILICFLTGAFYSARVLSKAIKLRLAADGEQYTGQELNYLMRSGAWVYHDIPYQYGNIDHIVISTGVFLP